MIRSGVRCDIRGSVCVFIRGLTIDRRRSAEMAAISRYCAHKGRARWTDAREKLIGAYFRWSERYLHSIARSALARVTRVAHLIASSCNLFSRMLTNKQNEQEKRRAFIDQAHFNRARSLRRRCKNGDRPLDDAPAR